MKLVFFALSIFLLLSGCSGSNKISSTSNTRKLRGTWLLNYITGPRIAFDGLFPGEKPTIRFDVSGKRVTGNTSCNSYSGSFDAEGTTINFKEPLTSTKMACPGEGESVFLKILEKINTYDVTEGYTLSLFTDGVASMRFTRVK